MDIQIPLDKEQELIEELKKRDDFDAKRMLRYLEMPDLSRTSESPIHEIVEKVKAIPSFQGFDVITIPEIVPSHVSFDLFNFEADHPARSKSDTYYVNDEYILRTHDTVFWYYYLNLPEVKEKIKNGEPFGTLCYGKVYRKDEVDSRHMNVFHQIGGWYLAPDSTGISFDDLKQALSDVAKGIYGEETQIRFNEDDFPYTDPSLEVEINVKGTAAEGPARGEWLEILGGGMVRKTVLKNMGVEGYSGWAFGFGIERLAIASMALPDIRLLWSDDERVKKQLKLGKVYEEVSKFPPALRDISFIVSKDFVPNDYFDMVRDVAETQVEEIELIDEYENDEKFGKDKKSYAYRITYRSLERTLTSEEVDTLHKQIEERTKDQFGGEVR